MAVVVPRLDEQEILSGSSQRRARIGDQLTVKIELLQRTKRALRHGLDGRMSCVLSVLAKILQEQRQISGDVFTGSQCSSVARRYRKRGRRGRVRQRRRSGRSGAVQQVRNFGDHEAEICSALHCSGQSAADTAKQHSWR